MNTTILKMQEASFVKAAEAVRRGGLIAYPTDTVYGLGCDPLNPSAVRKLFEAKGRTSKPVPVLCNSAEKVGELVELSPRAKRLADMHWPGPLTIVAPLRRDVPAELTQGGPNLGVRVPGHPGCLKLLGACGGWLTGTSANISGSPSARSAQDVSEQLGEFLEVILDGGVLMGQESTVVQVVGDTVAILRTGPVGVAVE